MKRGISRRKEKEAVIIFFNEFGRFDPSKLQFLKEARERELW